MTNLAIDIQNLSVSFKDFKALQNLDLKVSKGSAMALLGQNGAGKTTTLRTLVNIYAAEQGSGSLIGFPLGSDNSEFFQKIGYVSENQELPLNWTIEKLIKYLRPQYPTWDDELCQSLLNTFELCPKYRIGQLSRGMFMKVALLSSMAYRPELLILDEPFSGLDPLAREELIDAILDLMNGENWTILLSSHDVHEVEQLCDQVTILNRGTYPHQRESRISPNPLPLMECNHDRTHNTRSRKNPIFMDSSQRTFSKFMDLHRHSSRSKRPY